MLVHVVATAMFHSFQRLFHGFGARDDFEISLVIAACRARFRRSVSCEIMSSALFVALSIAVMRAPCSPAEFSSRVWKIWKSSIFGRSRDSSSFSRRLVEVRNVLARLARRHGRRLERQELFDDRFLNQGAVVLVVGQVDLVVALGEERLLQFRADPARVGVGRLVA